MTHFGIISPPVSGHLNPMAALGRELQQRGHQVTFLQMPDIEAKVRSEGLDFLPIGQSDHPLGSLPESIAQTRSTQWLEGSAIYHSCHPENNSYDLPGCAEHYQSSRY